LRIAKTDPVTGAGELDRVATRLTPAQRAYAWGQVGVAAAKRVLPDAGEYFRRADAAEYEARASVLSDEARQWQARAALRAGDWAAVRASIERMSPVTRHESTWVYWHARTLMTASQADREQATRLFGTIAQESSFYGMLAAEEIDRPLVVPARPAASTVAELAPMQRNAGFARALRLYALNLRPEGNREWNWQLRGMNDRQLLAAAEFAREREAFDRTVNTAERTRTEHDYSLRYVMPFRDLFVRKAGEANLDAAWVYGLVRQESRFVLNARSGVGAAGLMQIMPATARYVAKRIGMSQFRPSQADELETNITLGTHYLRLVAEDFGGSAVLASAAYNAGPGRARQWRNAFAGPVEGAIFAETIPFNETRDYVKKVLANAMVYAALLDGGLPSLKSRLGQVVPGGTGNAELP
jgi:soluble lytic murein transglycosylase